MKAQVLAIQTAKRLDTDDSVMVYREVKGADADVLGWALVGTFPCFLRRTENYDEPKVAGIRSKSNNMMTSDVLFVAYGTDIKPQDRVKVTTGQGDSEWLKVNGADKATSTNPPQSQFFVLPDAAIPDLEII